MHPSKLRLLAVLFATAFLAGCGDDDVAVQDAGTDASSSVDAGFDAETATDAGTGVDDAGSDGGSPFAPCDPFTADSCGTGMKCVLVQRSTGPMSYQLAVGCVPSSLGTVGEGLPCSSADATPGDTTDSWLASNCRQGFSCLQHDRTYPTCEPICNGTHTCNADEACALFDSDGTPGACILWDACDPVFQRGCSAGKGCYLLFDGTTDRGASQCVPVGATAVGDPCPSFEFAGFPPCVPGSQCYARPLPDGGTDGDYRCRAYCATGPTTDGGIPDGGVPDAGALDAGLAGACPSTQTCVPPAEWVAIHSPTPTGICI